FSRDWSSDVCSSDLVATDNQADPTPRRRAADLRQWPPPTITASPETQPTAPLPRPVEGGHQVSGGGLQNQPQHGNTVADQGDIDGELRAAGNEFPGAIQGIQQPAVTPLAPLIPGLSRGFLGNHGHPRQQLVQTGQDKLLGQVVGGGYRRVVALAGGDDPPAADSHDGRPGAAGQGTQGILKGTVKVRGHC